MKDVADDLAFIARNAIAYIKVLEAELARCKQVCAASAEAWREEAAMAEPVQEPVAWYFEARHIDSAWAAAVTLKHPGPEGVYMRNVKPLYLAPPQRKP